jgi:FMN phosphatase YigB (HAD superfamily)
MKIVIDIDEVLRQFINRLIIVYKHYYPDHEIKEITEWKLAPFFPIGDRITDFYAKNFTLNIYLYADPFEGTKKFIDILKEMNHDIILVSSQPSLEAEKFTIDWLEKNNIYYDVISFMNKKRSKHKWLIEGDIYLDDSPENIIELRKQGKRAVYFTRKWNENYPGERVSSFQEFIDLVKNMDEIEEITGIGV